MVKPDATQHLGAILSAIYKAGLTVVHLRTAWLSPGEAAVFYAVHKDRPFFAKLQGQQCTSQTLDCRLFAVPRSRLGLSLPCRLPSTLSVIHIRYCGLTILQSS